MLLFAGLAFDDDSVRDETGQITEGGEVGAAFRIRLGDCMVDPGEGTIESVEAVPCSDPHDLEIYLHVQPPGLELPVRHGHAGRNGCYNTFEPFVGKSYESSVYDFMIITPTPESWDELDDREVLCALTGYDGQATFASARAPRDNPRRVGRRPERVRPSVTIARERFRV